MSERCLQQIIGSCLGCPIQEMADRRLGRNGQEPVEQVLQKVARELCPDGTSIQLAKPVKQSIW